MKCQIFNYDINKSFNLHVIVSNVPNALRKEKNKTNKEAAYGEFADCEAACGSFHGQK